MNTKPKKFIPNIITLTNMFLGFLSIGLIFNGDPLKAGTFIIIAAFLDAFDGKTARLLQIESRFGMEFDSMADSISFCVAPSVLIYSLYVDGLNPLVGSIISFMPIMFGTIRLAKFNINHAHGIKKTHTSGLTTPIASITIFSYPIFNDQLFGGYGDPRIALFIVAGVSFLMVSPIHFFKFPLLGLFANAFVLGVLCRPKCKFHRSTLPILKLFEFFGNRIMLVNVPLCARQIFTGLEE